MAKRDPKVRLRLYFELRGLCRKVTASEFATLCDGLLEVMPEKGDTWPFWADGLRLWKAERQCDAETPDEAKALAEAVQKHAAKRKDRHTEARATWVTESGRLPKSRRVSG